MLNDLLKSRLPGLRVSDTVSVGWGPVSFASNKFPGGLMLTDQGPPFENRRAIKFRMEGVASGSRDQERLMENILYFSAYSLKQQSLT